MQTNIQRFYLFLIIFSLVLIVFSTGILIIDNYFIHQSILEISNFNQQLNKTFEQLETTQQETLKNIEDNVYQKLTEMANDPKLFKKKIQDPTATEWIFIAGILTLCFYGIISLGFSK